ncbi:hypothetical protein BWQ96_05335 [Gracilariopsis chorda]|uniref:Uncharacterized protein n=1 Tax=Gracilariopsis chorda TaxID=448386 RepID=A0A2V3IS11_9FLOR|nr:hypothetical protein BWQ96_05335 [Gracilariopsis chorda]|eukprot:PXF44915.1 hypothetical protein BWQ96_05335 [Gracilariopsis chorda]
MYNFILLCFFVLIICVFTEDPPVFDICPNQCYKNSRMPIRECRRSNLAHLCSVRRCSYSGQEDNGFSCSLPERSFLLKNSELWQWEMVITYWWESGKRDLDTSTRFLGANVGFKCGKNSKYLRWLGDSSKNGGDEQVVVDFDKARRDGLWTGRTSIQLHAGWHGSQQQGMAHVVVGMRRTDNHEEGNNLYAFIYPGTQRTCSPHQVAAVKIFRGRHFTRVTLDHM